MSFVRTQKRKLQNACCVSSASRQLPRTLWREVLVCQNFASPLLCAFFVQKSTWTLRCLLLLLPQRISGKVPCPLLLKAANDALHGLFSTKTPSNPTCLLFFQATAVTTHVQKGLSLSCMTPCPAFLASSRAQMDGRRTNVCSPNLQKCSYIFSPHLRRVCKSSLLSRELFLPSFLLLSSARPKRLH